MKTQWKKLGLPILITAVLGAILFYFTIPAVNLRHPSFYQFLLTLAIIFIVARICITTSLKSIKEKLIHIDIKGKSNNGKVINPPSRHKKVVKRILWIIAAVVLIALGIWLSSSEIFNASRYQQMLNVEVCDFQEDVAEIPLSQIPIVDKETAIRLGNRKLGEVVELTSQFEVSGLYSQINYNNAPTRVSPLQYASIIKWFTNQSDGIPYYISIDMATQDTSLIQLEQAIRYSPYEYFNRNLERHIRFHYPTLMFESPTFEIDDDGNPYWVVPIYTYTIGILGGKDIDGILMVDAITGDIERYQIGDVPQWVDQVYPSSMLNLQANNWGKYTNGYFNSMFGQKNVIQTTDGYNYLALDDDVWMYTGLTSVTADQSNIGFILCNMRTKETHYYQINGADESSAMGSAEGKIQEKSYNATFPILVNIEAQPTYFVSLKDAAGLVKEYAFVSVEDYQIVGVGDTLSSAQDSYVGQLKNVGKETASDEKETKETWGIISEITSAVKEGNTYYYFKLKNDDSVYIASITLSDALPLLKEDDSLKLKYTVDTMGFCQVLSLQTE